MAKAQDKEVSLRRQMMSNAMMRVANKFKDEDARKAALELKKLSQQPKEK